MEDKATSLDRNPPEGYEVWAPPESPPPPEAPSVPAESADVAFPPVSLYRVQRLRRAALQMCGDLARTDMRDDDVIGDWLELQDAATAIGDLPVPPSRERVTYRADLTDAGQRRLLIAVRQQALLAGMPTEKLVDMAINCEAGDSPIVMELMTRVDPTWCDRHDQAGRIPAAIASPRDDTAPCEAEGLGMFGSAFVGFYILLFTEWAAALWLIANP